MSMEHKLEDLVADGLRSLIVDVSGLDQIDSAGLGMLMVIAGRLEQVGGRMAIAGGRGTVAKSFGVVHIEKVVPLYPDVNSATAAIDGSGARGAA